VIRPNTMLSSAPSRGRAGISQTVDTAPIYRRVRGVSMV
jgi:hypothetical protein